MSTGARAIAATIDRRILTLGSSSSQGPRVPATHWCSRSCRTSSQRRHQDGRLLGCLHEVSDQRRRTIPRRTVPWCLTPLPLPSRTHSKQIRPSYVGNRQDAVEALAFAVDGKVKVEFKVKGLSELPQVYDDMHHGRIAGRIVLDNSR